MENVIIKNSTKALLKDLEESLNSLNRKTTNIEVIWGLEQLKKQIDISNKLILKNIGSKKIEGI